MRGARALAVAAALACTSLAACGGQGPAPHAARDTEVAPSWQDIFNGTPELLAVIRPKAMKRDPVYGSLFTALMRVAQARSPMGGVTALEAAQDAEEIVVGVRKSEDGREDAVIVFRGVPASLDPARMTDEGGRPLFRLVDERAKVPELERTAGTGSGALFVLPGRTWVITLGEARARARLAFAHPFGRPAPEVDPHALATLRLDARAFVLPRLPRGSVFGPVARKLTSVSLALAPDKGGVVVRLHYTDEDASAWAEMQAKQLMEELVRADAAPRRGHRPSLAWLSKAEVDHQGSVVIVRLAVPARLLEALPRATATDLPF